MPLSTLASWVLSITCIMSVLHVVGINVQPLLAAGGVSGIALGFGAQKITQNLLAGIMLVRMPTGLRSRPCDPGPCDTGLPGKHRQRLLARLHL